MRNMMNTARNRFFDCKSAYLRRAPHLSFFYQPMNGLEMLYIIHQLSLPLLPHHFAQPVYADLPATLAEAQQDRLY